MCGDVHREVGAVNLNLQKLFKLFIEVFVSPVLILSVNLSCLIKSFHCFFDSTFAHILHEKCEETSVDLTHAVVVVQSEARVVEDEILTLFEVHEWVKNPQVIDLSEHGQSSDIDLRPELLIVNHIVFLRRVH